MKPFPRAACHKPFPNPPTHRHAVSNALAILHAEMKSASTPLVIQDLTQRRFRIFHRYFYGPT